MAYTTVDYKTKKEFNEAFKRGDKIRVFQPGPFGPNVHDGTIAIEGPHYPKPHTWYASVEVRDGIVVRMRK